MAKLCTIKFILKKGKKQRDGFIIYARILYAREKAELSTGEFCREEDWDSSTGLTRNENRINDHLEFIKTTYTSC